MENSGFYFMLSYLANLCQIVSFNMNITETKNEDIMKHLFEQDQTLAEQINVYLKKIIEQNEEILELLKNK